jgi:hypothetical protein
VQTRPWPEDFLGSGPHRVYTKKSFLRRGRGQRIGCTIVNAAFDPPPSPSPTWPGLLVRFFLGIQRLLSRPKVAAVAFVTLKSPAAVSPTTPPQKRVAFVPAKKLPPCPHFLARLFGGRGSPFPWCLPQTWFCLRRGLSRTPSKIIKFREIGAWRSLKTPLFGESRGGRLFFASFHYQKGRHCQNLYEYSEMQRVRGQLFAILSHLRMCFCFCNPV